MQEYTCPLHSLQVVTGPHLFGAKARGTGGGVREQIRQIVVDSCAGGQGSGFQRIDRRKVLREPGKKSSRQNT